MGASKAWSSQNNQRSIHISNPLSLSKKSERKSKEFEVGTYILLEIDWSERWGVEPWSEDKVWCENLSVKLEDLGAFQFWGFDDLGVLKIWGFWFSIWRLKLEVLRKFKFAGVFIQVAIHDLGFSFSEMSSRAQSQWSCYFFHAYFKGFYGCWNSSVKKIAYSEGHRQKSWVV